MLKSLKVSTEAVEANGEGWVAVDPVSLASASLVVAISDRICDRHLLATVLESPVLFRSSSFLCCSGVRSL